MIELPKLNNGDTIGVLAPARKVVEEELQGFKKWCNQHQWKVCFASHLFDSDNQFAGSDGQRISDFNELLSNPEVKAIFCARGGYGSARIIDHVNWDLLKKYPKWICGYSDITAIHQHLLNQYKCPSLHCLMPLSFVQYNDPLFHESASLTAHFLKTSELTYSLPQGQDVHDIESAQITGGNLSVLYSLMGSKSFSHNTGRIVFIEDLDEYLYHIDRMFNSLQRSGFFEGVKLIISGGLTDMHDNTVPFGKTAEEICAYYANKLNIPYLSNFPVGHIAMNFPIPIGWFASIKNNKITFAIR